MFCRECGLSMPAGSTFCKRCGCKVNVSELSHYSASNFNSISTNSYSNEISRDAIVIYLNNMRIIETVIHKSKQEKNNLESSLKEKEYELNYLNNENSKLKENNKGYNFLFHVFLIGIAGCFIGAIIGLIIALFYWFLKDIFDFLFGESSPWKFIFPCMELCGIIGVCIGCVTWKSIKNDIQNEINLKHEYEEKIFQKQKEYDEMKQKYQPIINGLENDISKYKKLAQDGYSINIIPYSSNPDSNCRCLEGVFFLHEFMSTGRESLTTALTHYKLDQISKKLDRLIEVVNEVIINQREILYEQGRVLNQLKCNEKQLSKLNDYTEIAAHNSALQVEMKRESLFYQRINYLKSW